MRNSHMGGRIFPACCICKMRIFVSSSVIQQAQHSATESATLRYNPHLALLYEHWRKTAWENRSPSGTLFLKRVNGVPHREIGRDAHGCTQVFRPESPLPFACAKGLICFIIVKSVWHFSASAFFSFIAATQ